MWSPELRGPVNALILRIHGHAIGMLAALCGTLVAAAAQAQSPEASDWAYYGGDAFGQHYSSLEQVRRDNVNTLTEAWTYRTGELGAGLAAQGRLVFDVTPVLAFGLLYLETAANIVIALDPVTGKERWRYDPRIDRSRDYPQLAARGVSIWEDPDASRQGACTHRILLEPTMRGCWPLMQLPADPAATSAMRGRSIWIRSVPEQRLHTRQARRLSSSAISWWWALPSRTSSARPPCAVSSAHSMRAAARRAGVSIRCRAVVSIQPHRSGIGHKPLRAAALMPPG